MESEKQQTDASPAVADGLFATTRALETDQDTSQKTQEPQKCSEDPSLNLTDNCSASSEHQGEPQPLPPVQHGSSAVEHEGSQGGSGSGDQGTVQEEATGKDQGSDQGESTKKQAEMNDDKREEAGSHKQEMRDGGSSNEQEVIHEQAGSNEQEIIQEEANGKDQGSDQGESSKKQAEINYDKQANVQEEAGSHNQEMRDGGSSNEQEVIQEEAGSNKQEIIQDGDISKKQETLKDEDKSEEQDARDTDPERLISVKEETKHKEEIIKEQEGAHAQVQEGSTGQELGEDLDVWGDGVCKDNAREDAVGPEALEEATGRGGQGMGRPGADGGSFEEETGILVAGQTGDHREQKETAAEIQETGDTGDQMGRSEQNVPRDDTFPLATRQGTHDNGGGNGAEVIGPTEHRHATFVVEAGIPVKEAGTDKEEDERAPGEQGAGEDIGSAVKVTDSVVQVTAEESGEGVTGADRHLLGKEIQEAGDETVTRFLTTGDETDTLTHVRAEGADVTGTVIQAKGDKSGIGEQQSFSGEKSQELPFASTPSPVEEFTGEQVKTAEAEAGVAGESGTGGQVSASGEEAERKVTPDPAPVPNREGAAGPDRPEACREKEWPPLMCTGADTAGQGETGDQEKVTEKELKHETPEMKDREFVEASEMPPAETPIEREIRLSIERENILRQERGISSPVGQQELVEVRRRTVVVEKEPTTGKERQLAGAQMQRDIQLETRREQDLVQLGKVMGTYDRGPQQELQERKQIFENIATVSSEPGLKKRQSTSFQAVVTKTPIAVAPAVPTNLAQSAPAPGGKKGPSYTEANGSNVILIEHSSFLQRSAPAKNSVPASADLPRPSKSDSPQPASGNLYQLVRSSSPRSLLEREIEEVQEREKELRKQRSSVYGRDEILTDETKKKSGNQGGILSGTYQPERPNWRKLEVNWPPNPDAIMNGQQSEQPMDSPRTRRQRSTLIQSWEAGTPYPLDE